MTYKASTQAKGLPFAILCAGSALLSLKFACATPLVALATVAAATFPPRTALLTALALWGLNQAAGYWVLGYPLTADSVEWGALMGLATVLSARVAQTAFAASSGMIGVRSTSVAFLAAFAVYEGALFAASLILGGIETFSPAIVFQVFLPNAAVIAVYLAAYRGSVALVPAYSSRETALAPAR